MDEIQLGAVDHRFNEVDHRFNRLESIVAEGRGQHSAELVGINARIDLLHRTIIFVGGMVVGSVIVSSALLIAVHG